MSVSYTGRVDYLDDDFEITEHGDVTAAARVVVGAVVEDRGEYRAVLPNGAEVGRGTRAACLMELRRWVLGEQA